MWVVDKLRKYFSAYGTIQDAVVMKDPVSRRSRGFGFITFLEIDAVDNVLDNEPHIIDSRKVDIVEAISLTLNDLLWVLRWRQNELCPGNPDPPRQVAQRPLRRRLRVRQPIPQHRPTQHPSQ
jgi:RNA recognition motif-containing protein